MFTSICRLYHENVDICGLVESGDIEGVMKPISDGGWSKAMLNAAIYTAFLPHITYTHKATFLNCIKVLVDAGADTNMQLLRQPNAGQTPVAQAIVLKNKDVLKVLLDASQTDMQNSYHIVCCPDGRHPFTVQDGYPAVLHCAAKGESDLLEMLLEAGADVSVTDNFGNTAALWSAVYHQHEECVRLLLAHGATVLNQSNYDCSENILCMAIAKGNERILGVLLESGADVNDQDESTGNTALMKAAQLGKLNISQLLVEHGAWLNHANYNDQGPVFMALTNGHLHVAEYLLNAPTDKTVVKKIADTSLVALAVNTPLPFYYHYMSLARHLLKYYGCIDSAKHDGRPLFLDVADCLIDSEDPRIPVSLMVDLGESADIQDMDGCSVVATFINRSMYWPMDIITDIIIHLINSKADINIKTHLLCHRLLGHDPYYQGLFNHESLETPLEISLRSGSVLCARMFWLAGSSCGRTAQWDVKALPWYRYDECRARVQEPTVQADVLDFLTATVLQQRGLADCARIVVRTNLQSVMDIHELQLPDTLLDYLTLPEFKQIKIDAKILSSS